MLLAPSSNSCHSLAVALLAGVLNAGCSNQQAATGEVHGKVTYRGQPVSAGIMRFFPAAGGSVSTFLGPQGTYRATGVPFGNARVAIETSGFSKLKGPPAHKAKLIRGSLPVYVALPERYEQPDTAQIAAVINETSVQFDIDLP